ncbi:ferredoxin [Promicromonospora sp. NPDC057488]|uniref:ferredoxin n=1 Tax=Promicromonospora sp. NPDC057488 TaxID=3346147 RepID=UPI003672D2E0
MNDETLTGNTTTGTHRIELDEPRCVAAGQCVMVAPDVFDQRDEDGVAVILDETPGEAVLDDVREAVAVCPAAALRLVAL